ncbi:MAG: DUF3332 family protein [Pseudomonadota bacterium]
MNRILRLAGVTVLSASVLSGCIGRFALTDKVYTWNKHVDQERWVNEGVFLVFIILPVYGLTLLADGVIFNSVEWWTGRNPILAAGEQREVRGEDGSVAVMTLREDGSIAVAVTAADGVRSDFSLVRNVETGLVTAYDDQGHLMATSAGAF